MVFILPGLVKQRDYYQSVINLIDWYNSKYAEVLLR